MYSTARSNQRSSVSMDFVLWCYRTAPCLVIPPLKPIACRLVAIVCMLFLVVVPLLCFAALILLWVVPCTHETRFKAYLLSGLLRSWSAVDVYLVSVLTGAMQIPGLVKEKVTALDNQDANDLLGACQRSEKSANQSWGLSTKSILIGLINASA